MALDSDAVVVSVVPGLLEKAGVALPDLHLDTVARSGASVEAVVSSRNLDGGGAAVDNPLLSIGAVAVVADWMSEAIYGFVDN